MMFNPCMIIPVYNHGGTASLLSQISDPLPVIVVDDGSCGSYARDLDQLDKEYEHVTLVRHDCNMGKGRAVMTALKVAHDKKFTHALQIDADGQHDANDIPAFLSLSRKNPSAFISGHRMHEYIPASRYWGRYVTHMFVWLESLSFSIKDSMTGFRVYPVLPTIRLIQSHRIGERMDFDPEILVRLFWESVPILWLPIRVVYRDGGVSHFRLWRDNFLISFMHVRLLLGMLRRFPRLMVRKLQ